MQNNFMPGFFVIGLGFGIMLTSSVTVVQSEFLTRIKTKFLGYCEAVRILGSSYGVSIINSVLVLELATAVEPFILAYAVMMGFAIVGMVAAILIPKSGSQSTKSSQPTKQSSKAK